VELRRQPYWFVAGSNMHCSVGLAILVKVGPISDCFDGGTHAVSIVGTPGFAQVAIFHGRGGVVVQTAANTFGVRPASDHMRCAEPHELAARIGHFEQGTERGLRRLKLDLGLRRAAEKEREDYGRTDAYEHAEPLSAIFLRRVRYAQLAATTIGWDARVTTGEPL